MNDFDGEVFSGTGKAAEFLGIDEYSDFFREKLGEQAYPGTLNLYVEPEKVEKLKQEARKLRLEGFSRDDKDFGGITAYPVNVEGLEALLLEIDKTHYGSDVAEIVAGACLRDELGLEDGDKVSVVSRSF